MKHIAIIMAAGSGKRMGSDKPKQYLEIDGHPILYYSIKAFEDSFSDEIILVTRESDIEYCRKEIVEKYAFGKVAAVVAGGKERSDSVFNGLKAVSTSDSFVYIHDGARPFIDEELLERVKKSVEECNACVAAVPVTDTIKMSRGDGVVDSTIDRSLLWAAQTPQAFRYDVIMDAFSLFEKEKETSYDVQVTDDASIVEMYGNVPVKIVHGSYMNRKITTPEDLK